MQSIVSARELGCAVETLAQGGWLISRPILDHLRRSAVAPAGGQAFTEGVRPAIIRAERAVLRLLIEGRSNAEIAGLLSVARTTIRSHVRSILQKTGCENRHQVTARAHQGLLGEALAPNFSPQAEDMTVKPP
ncbi:MAG: response regulator transcription factor [Dermatophilaceae bacterium]